ncbi:alpha-ketoacid dehydrogenase subunit alpha/beta [Lentzea flaviverrucosa]|uniref:dihydrolipoyllysine-residue succinyltransferase n=1 Tax=Lentzea flaviverrucosa TaxID=200379 RepID=A0A1H9WUS6_9PSEU|nr:thiamine pyrophosphate-dependent enzyme [Lentzea flaviverrucosa]RDI23118.1 2-oxoisovalerate dehydrogenase E1 component [Lentzea flaviverrucosa]SES37569.1 2-oxoisovalerate dehydrogenase E1 component [Lentzea flaviverrucosa]
MDRRGILRKALLVRRVEEKLLELFASGELAGTVHTCVGQEFSAAVISEHIRDHDAVFSNHRCHGHYLATTGDVPGLVAEVMGRRAGVCGGRGGSQHLHRGNFLSTGVQGGCVPIAAGAALARKTRNDGGVAVCFIGDGTLGEGVVYEVLNLASLWKLPLVLVVEDNSYAQSTPRTAALAGTIAARASAFGVESARADTWSWEELWATAGKAFDHVRSGGGPFLLEVQTYRLGAHSKGDDDRDPAEIAARVASDPLNTLLREGSDDLPHLDEEIRVLVDSAVAEALASSAEAEVPSWPGEPAVSRRWSPASADPTRFVDALRASLDQLLHRREDVHVLGEDVESPYGGAFKATRGLSFDHPGRVRNTPISEAALVGVATGLSLNGFPTFAEIMFGDFVTLAADQIINHAAKLGFLAGGDEPPVDVVVRTPMGGGRGYGPTHSQSLEKIFFGVPGLRVLAFNSLLGPKALVEELGRGGAGPTLLLENKLLYGRQVGAEQPRGFTTFVSDERFPTALVRSQKQPHVTLLGYGGVCDDLLVACRRLFLEHDLIAQVLCPTAVHPFRLAAYADVLNAAPALVVVEEGQGFGGFGAEVLAQVTELGPAGPRVRRVVPAASPLPASREAERRVLPCVDDIVRAAVEMRSPTAASREVS